MAENDELEDFDSFTTGVKTGGKSLVDFNKMVRKIIMAEGEQYLKTNKMNGPFPPGKLTLNPDYWWGKGD